MKKIVLRYIKDTFLVITFYLFTLCTFSIAAVYSDINVKGNKRLSVETVLMFSGLKLNTDITNEELNNAIKKLYETNYFKDIKIFISENSLLIEIVENPIVQRIDIKGIKNKSILKQLESITKKVKNILFLSPK